LGAGHGESTGFKLQSLSFSPIVLGGFNLVSENINGTNFMIATYEGWNGILTEELVNGAANIFKFQKNLFGGKEEGFMMIVFCPKRDDFESPNIGEWSTGNASMHDNKGNPYDWLGVSHGIFHRWNVWRPWGLRGSDQWLIEGLDVFYEYRITSTLGLTQISEIEHRLNERIEQYEKTVSTGQNLFWGGTDSPLANSKWPFTIYIKASMVFLELAKEVYLQTNGEKSIDDIVSQMYQLCFSENWECSNYNLLQIINNETKSDFSQFFNDYVFGKEMIDFSWVFDDPDRDLITSGFEVLISTDPNNSDTDGDFISDYIEIKNNSNPLDKNVIPEPTKTPRPTVLPTFTPLPTAFPSNTPNPTSIATEIVEINIDESSDLPQYPSIFLIGIGGVLLGVVSIFLFYKKRSNE
jgi:hypothetical protein